MIYMGEKLHFSKDISSHKYILKDFLFAEIFFLKPKYYFGIKNKTY